MKNLVVTYYKFTDPLTDAQSKDIGLTYDVTYHITEILNIDGTPTITKDETHNQTVHILPSYDDAQVITKQAWDALDVSNESLIAKQTREKKLLRVEANTLRTLNNPIPSDPEGSPTYAQKLLQVAIKAQQDAERELAAQEFTR